MHNESFETSNFPTSRSPHDPPRSKLCPLGCLFQKSLAYAKQDDRDDVHSALHDVTFAARNGWCWASDFWSSPFTYQGSEQRGVKSTYRPRVQDVVDYEASGGVA